MKTNQEFLDQAKKSLSGNWGIAIGGHLIAILILGTIQIIPVVGVFAGILIGGPMTVGLAYFSLRLAKDEEARIEQLFVGFNDFGRTLGAYLLVAVYTILWALLLIIPGLIKSMAYTQTFFILAEDAEISADDAIVKSMDMMDGYKWKYFFLAFHFIGWSILSVLTLGIGFLFLIPYMQVSTANFYLEVKENYEQQQHNA